MARQCMLYNPPAIRLGIKEEQAIIAVTAHLAVKKVNKAQSKINKETEGTITEKVALDKETVFELFDEYHAKLD